MLAPRPAQRVVDRDRGDRIARREGEKGADGLLCRLDLAERGEACREEAMGNQAAGAAYRRNFVSFSARLRDAGWPSP